MSKFFRLKENGTTVSTEFVAGLTTFFAMSYIIFVNPDILSAAGMPKGAVFLATIFATLIGTLIMGLFANVPYAQAPGMGLNAFFTFTVVFAFGFTWQQALSMVFICGLVNVIITVTRIRKVIIRAIPKGLQNAIGGGIGVFIAYIGLLNAKLISIDGVVPALVDFKTPALLLAVFGIILTMILLVKKIKGAILWGILGTTAVGVIYVFATQGRISDTLNIDTIKALGDVNIIDGMADSFKQLDTTVFAVFSEDGIVSLFNDASKIPLVLVTIFAFSITDTFDTIGTFIGTGRKTGIFTAEDEEAMANSKGFRTKMDRALVADSVATSIGALIGTSNTTTYVESAAGIGVGGKTGLTSVFTSLFFVLCIPLSAFIGIVPAEATAPALIAVGIMMLSAFKEIEWTEFEEALPAFFAGIFMALSYSISYGIGTGFIFYCLVKILKGKFKEIHPVLGVSTLLFILNFVLLAIV